MLQRRFLRGMGVLVFCFLIVQDVSHASVVSRRVHGGLSVGMGLPKIPLSRFRSPVSVTGGVSLSFRLMRRIGIQTGGYGLYTFNLGTRDGQDGELRFNLAWFSVDVLGHLGGVVKSESFVLVGLGGYHLSRQIEADETIQDTMGLNLGLAHWQHWLRWSSVLEVRWHLLFRPGDNPQVLTLTFGVLL